MIFIYLLKLSNVWDVVENNSYRYGAQKEKPKSNWTDDDKKKVQYNL